MSNTTEEIKTVAIVDEMKQSYLDYAMSVIVSRALPDVRDGLKPVHRRIIYSMYENGYDYNKPFKKSARIVGDVMGKYHPHGDAAIYDTMVRMSQDFAMRVPLIDGQGNFGSMDGDSAAAMRYTEARLEKVTHTLIDDIDKDTVDFSPNYDESTKEPNVLPARYPNLLVNGTGGIAVGMATNIPPHNLGEIIDGCLALIDNPETTGEDLLQIIPGPDFPTGGIILGRRGCRQAALTGRGSVIMRAKCDIEEEKDRESIIVTEIPYQVNKAAMIQKIAELVKEGRIEGISDIRDESDRDGVRVVIEVKKSAQANIILNQLFKFTPLQTSFGVNMLALNGIKPEVMDIRKVLEIFISFREEVIRRRTAYELNKARAKAHNLVGLAIAVDNLDEVVELIKKSPTPLDAKLELMTRDWPAESVRALIELIDEPDRKIINGIYKLSEIQAKAILDLKLHRLTGLEREKIHAELIEIGEAIKEYLSILCSREKLYGILRQELVDIKTEYNTPRRTQIEDLEFEHDIEDLIQREEMVVTVTDTGYIKRVPLSEYRAQKRGGKGRSGMSTKEEDYVTTIFIASTHTPVLFFSNIGQVYKMKVYKLPQGTPQSKGKPFVNLLPLSENETITAVLKLPENDADCENMHIMFATSIGSVRKNKLSDFINVMANGKRAMSLEDKEETLIGVKICNDDQDVLLTCKMGKCIRFPVSDIRVFASRSSMGVRGMKLAKGDKIVNMSILQHIKESPEAREEYLKTSRRLKSGEITEQALSSNLEIINEVKFYEMQSAEEYILTVSEDGYGKRTSSYEYRIAGRGGLGIKNTDLSRGISVVSSFPITEDQQVMLVTDQGKLIRIPVNNISVVGRASRGVILFRTDKGEKVVSAAIIDDEGDKEEEIENTEERVLSSETIEVIEAGDDE